MKKLFYFLLITIANCITINAQHNCGFGGSSNSQIPSNNSIEFFSESVCNPITLKCNIVIFNRDGGGGGLSAGSSLWQDWEQAMNSNLANIIDSKNCSTGYPLDSKIRVKFTTHTINNTKAWDWYAEANRDNFPSSIRPNVYVCPRFNGRWDDLEYTMKSFEQAHFGEINFFFIENGELIDILESHIANGTKPSGIYVDRFVQYFIDNPDCGSCGGIAGGCSIFPKDYNSSSSQNSYVIANVYSDYLIRNHFHDIWFPPYAHLPASTVWGWSFYNITFLYLHEMGHNILNMYHDRSCSQLMTDLWDDRTNHITKDQLNRIHRNLATTDLHNAVDCNSINSGTCNIKVTGNATISSPMSIFGDLEINPGSTLTINSEVHFSEFSSIIVHSGAKLIVDGGKLTNDCKSTWEGIVVEGGNGDFDVKLTNSIVENTSRAAVSTFAGNGNGILLAENTVFNNCRRLAELTAWRPLPNTSYIRNCTQNGGKYGVTNWNCQGVEVSNSTFNGISDHCIASETGSFLLENNIFKSGMNDVFFNNPSAGLRSIIKKNTFRGSNIGYNARGTTFAQNLIEFNKFKTSFLDVLNDGHNNFDLKDNNIEGMLGAASFANGPGIADVNGNLFNNNFVGAFAFYQNSDYNFFQNCFNTINEDVYIDGTVSPIIATGMHDPANNCFTHDGNLGSSVLDITGNPNPFNYVEPNDNIVDCRDAILAHPAVNRTFNGHFVDKPTCGVPPGIIPNDDPEPLCGTDGSALSLPQIINSISNSITQTYLNISLNPIERANALNQLNGCLKEAKGNYFELLIKEGNFTGARAIYSEDVSNEAIINIFSSYIFENNLNGARLYLNQLYPLEETMQDFRTIQYINLDRLLHGPYFEASPEVKSIVLTIANKNHFTAAYAKALYYSLTGEVISSQIPVLFANSLNPRNRIEQLHSEYLKCSPNPFNNELLLEIKGIKDGEITIFGIMENKVYSNKVREGNLKINSSEWNSGIYFIRLQSENKVMDTKMVVRVK
ncbi:MAG: T9SS type A sorting domain-containing protein [Saprospiraceae bacterium]|jgi:hypothetical protein|nr:T9SS type A sorting domain-containing protein [Saprospiraceae bacterium]